MNSILQNGKIRVENQTKSRVSEDSSLCPETSTKILFEKSNSGYVAERAHADKRSSVDMWSMGANCWVN